MVSHENDRYHSHLGQIVPPFDGGSGPLEMAAGGQTVRGLHVEAVHVFETPERLVEDEVTIVHFRSEGLHHWSWRSRRGPGACARRGRAGRSCVRGRRAAGRRGRAADDRLPRNPRPDRRDRAEADLPDALQDAPDQPEDPARGAIPRHPASASPGRPGPGTTQYELKRAGGTARRNGRWIVVLETCTVERVVEPATASSTYILAPVSPWISPPVTLAGFFFFKK